MITNLIDWTKQSIPPQYQTQNLLILISTIDELIIRDKEGLINGLNSPYSLCSEEKYFYISNEIHILFKWIYKEVLLGLKNIGETAIVIDVLSLKHITNGTLMISTADYMLTSWHLTDFRASIANLTLRIDNIIQKICSQLISQPMVDEQNLSIQPNQLQKKTLQSKPRSFVIPSFGNSSQSNLSEKKIENENEKTDVESNEGIDNLLDDKKPNDLFTEQTSINQEIALPKLPKIPKMEVGSIRYSNKE